MNKPTSLVPEEIAQRIHLVRGHKVIWMLIWLPYTTSRLVFWYRLSSAIEIEGDFRPTVMFAVERTRKWRLD